MIFRFLINIARQLNLTCTSRALQKQARQIDLTCISKALQNNAKTFPHIFSHQRRKLGSSTACKTDQSQMHFKSTSTTLQKHARQINLTCTSKAPRQINLTCTSKSCTSKSCKNIISAYHLSLTGVAHITRLCTVRVHPQRVEMALAASAPRDALVGGVSVLAHHPAHPTRRAAVAAHPDGVLLTLPRVGPRLTLRVAAVQVGARLCGTMYEVA